MAQCVRSKGFIFTINIYTDDDIEAVRNLESLARYLICGKEVAPTTGTPHLQGYVYMNQQREFKAFCKKLPRASVQVGKGTASQNREYCTKGGDLLIEAGVPPQHGKRADLDQVKDQILAGDMNVDKYLREEPHYFISMAAHSRRCKTNATGQCGGHLGQQESGSTDPPVLGKVPTRTRSIIPIRTIHGS